MKRTVLIELITAFFVCLFLYTSLSKLTEHSSFVKTLSKSAIIGHFASVVTWAIPSTELIVVGLLIYPPVRFWGLSFSLLLMMVFTGYISYMILFVPERLCQCGGALNFLTWEQHLIFNIICMLIAVLGVIIAFDIKKQSKFNQ